MIKGLDYWYDNQQRRYLEQVVRAFSGFQYMTGWSEKDGVRIPPKLVMVDCSMAQTDRQVAHILKNNSENTLLTVPRITVHQSDLQIRREDLKNVNHIDTRQVVEREFDETTGQYTTNSKRGKSYTVMRLMPLPFTMTIQVDIWTSTLDQKYQLIEQIGVACMPDFDIQNSDNALDWTALTTCTFENMNWSSRSMPVGSDDAIEIMTLNFKLPIWLSPPAKVMQQNVIEQIVTNVHDGYAEDDILEQDRMFQNITTPGNHSILVQGNVITLLGAEGDVLDGQGKPYSWAKLIDTYDRPLRSTVSQIRLKTSPEQIDDWSHDLIGSIQHDTSAANQLIWTLDPDTLPVNSLPPIDGIINSLKKFPGKGLPNPARGQRYLLVNEQGGPSQAWGNLRASEGSIIEYQAGEWKVIYSPVRGDPTNQYVLNLGSGEQLRWNGEDWVKTIDGIYPPGYWRFNL
jgi:hypothetical protein